MAESLPDWLDHYLKVPAWVLYGTLDEMLWVNERLARDLGEPREWFVGRSVKEIWADSQDRGLGKIALAEQRSIDAIGDGRDLRGNWRWLDSRLTPVDDRHLLIVCQDVSARIQLAGLRLILGGGVAGESQGEFSEEFARLLLNGASLDEICKARSLSAVEVLAKLGRLVGEQTETDSGVRVVPQVAEEPELGAGVPRWVEYYWDLPGPAILLDYPALEVLWVNRQVLERNRMTPEEVVGIKAREIWEDVSEWMTVVERTMNEQRSFDTVHQGHNLRGEQQWMAVHTTPLGKDRLLILSEDVTADIRLQALRLLLGLNPSGPRPEAHITDAFARLLLDGATISNIAAALEMTADEVRGQAGLLLGRAE
jgi:hypothetical protein